jgi:hypothetical protein
MYCKYIELCGKNCNNAFPETCIEYKEREKIEKGPKSNKEPLNVAILLANGTVCNEYNVIPYSTTDNYTQDLSHLLNEMRERGYNYITIGESIFNIKEILRVNVAVASK